MNGMLHRSVRLVALIGMVVGMAGMAMAFDSGSTGTADLNITSTQTLPLPASGVLEYVNVTVASGATLKFSPNANNTSVTILASGNVTINGTIDVSGIAANKNIPGNGGPGGFAGGVAGAVQQNGSRGQGPGGGYGGKPDLDASTYSGGGGGGSYATAGTIGGSENAGEGGPAGVTYGAPSLYQLIGGSGGGGGGGTTTHYGGAGGGGGGALLIAASGTINVAGAIKADGGTGGDGEIYANSYGSYGSYGSPGGSGSGGAIRLVATTITGNGTISATGAVEKTAYNGENGGKGGDGRIRLEAENLTRTATTTPVYSRGYTFAVAPSLMPSLRIASINGMAITDAAKGSYGPPDIMLPFGSSTTLSVVVEGTNIPNNTSFTLKAHPSVGGTVNDVTRNGTLIGTQEATSATVSLPISSGYPSILTAYTTISAIVAFNEPVYADGELVAQVRIESTADGTSALTYITESGREIPATLM